MEPPAPRAEPSPLGDELRHTALLLGGSLGIIGLLAGTLLLLTRLGG